MSKDAEKLLRFFNDNVWTSKAYIQNQGYMLEAQELVDVKLIEENDDFYVISSKNSAWSQGKCNVD